MRRRIWNYSLVVISVLGVAISLYIEYLSGQPVCPVGFEGCERVLLSPYSRLLGLSLAMMGASWFAVLLVLSLALFYRGKRVLSAVVFGWSLTSIPSVAALTMIEVFLVGSICLYCTVAHILGLSSIIPAYRIWSFWS